MRRPQHEQDELADRLIACVLAPKAGEDPVDRVIAEVDLLSQDRLPALEERLMSIGMEYLENRVSRTEVSFQRGFAAVLIVRGPLRARKRGLSAVGAAPELRRAFPLIWPACEDTTTN